MVSEIRFSVCIPAYNRAKVLPQLLESILSQNFESYEVLVVEDDSPERPEIRTVIKEYSSRYGKKLRYEENEENLGYDRNLRRLIELAVGEFVLFMGNDDLMVPGALTHIDAVLIRNPGAGMYLRSYAAFEGQPENIVQTFRYFDRELYFEPGVESIQTVYRRSVVIPGMVFHRSTVRDVATDRFDGTLLYQLFLAAEVLLCKGAVFSPEIIVLYRNGGTPDFGNSDSEKGKFSPQIRTPESSILFIQGFLVIAEYIEASHGVSVYNGILKDLANYSYPLLSVQADKSKSIFLKYVWGLGKLGFRRFPIYWLYAISLFIFGASNMDKLVVAIKNKTGRTPLIGKVYTGDGN